MVSLITQSTIMAKDTANTKQATAPSPVKRGERVELESAELGIREFSVTEANNILNMPQNTGWKLPTNSKFQFTDGKVIHHGGTPTTTNA
jgi:hypothetical protein